MIDPAPRLDRWIEHSHAGQRTLHEDGLEFGLTLLSDDELAEVQGAKRLRKLPPMAREVDEYWGPRVKGFRVHPESGPKDLLSLEGTYVALYRTASRSAHPTIEGLDGCIDLSGRRPTVRLEHDDRTLPFALAVPLTAMALLVCHERLGWPDDDVVRALSDALLHNVEETSVEELP